MKATLQTAYLHTNRALSNMAYKYLDIFTLSSDIRSLFRQTNLDTHLV